MGSSLKELKDVQIFVVFKRIMETKNLKKDNMIYSMSSIIENEIPSIKNASLPYSLQALSERNCNEYSKNAKFKDQEKIYTIYNLLGGEGKPGYGSSSSAMDYLNDIEKRYTTTNSDDNFIDTNKKRLFSEAFY
jgi:hypothetical protein